ncbi:hypothetical protein MNV49_006976 [Pseudohyphozyma bogoriensis]|nr:hypothetical protein MNV49_006976 [Pseudohyphozyma bogoriensis]
MTDTPKSETINLGPDGERVVDMHYYDLLGVKSDADEATIKKAYRKAALIYHPDRNIGDEGAAAKFQEIGEAFAVLSDSNLRAVYNKGGKDKAVGGVEEMPDPGQMFSQLFGGDAFMDWIGEISLGKDVSKAFEMSTTEEEREAMKAEFTAEGAPGTPVGAATATSPSPAPTPTISHEAFAESVKISADAPAPAPSTSTPSGAAPASPSLGTTIPGTPLATTPSPAPTTAAEKKAAAEKAAAERKAEREKMEAYDLQRQEEKKERVRMLVKKLLERIRPFVESTNPGDKDDPETKRYAERIRQESHDLALESFGVEICNLIGEIYMVKANAYIKLHKKASSNILGIPAWGSRVKEKFTMLKEGWSFLSVGLDVQSAMSDLEKRQAKGELDEEEMKKIEMDLSGKLLLVAWKGSKFELSSVLRNVVDGALTKESSAVTDVVLMNRAKAILLTGAILKSVKAEETDAERRELERMVAEANAKRKEKGSKKKPASPAPAPAA